ncbi:Carboxyl/Cholinesterase 40, partial [Frankliniella occidentalis]
MKFLLLSGFLYCVCYALDPVIKVDQGNLLGKLEPGAASSASFYAFRGIPFAESPTGNLRFKAPRPPKSWTGLRNATTEGSVCTQATFTGQLIGSEDCLFLNVYTPKLNCTSLLPVLFFLHSSAFIFGDGGSSWYGPDFLNYNGVLLVTANYRLGPLGFLNLETAGAPGNAGLKDTLAALEWTKRNIKSFCGDPAKVTVGGHSAGAMMANVHTLLARSQGLFSRALLMSGNALTTVAYTDSHLEAARELAAMLGAKDNATSTVEDTLRKATGEQINAAHLAMLMNEPHPNMMFKFAMTSESPSASQADLPGSILLTTDPETLLRAPEVKTVVPILTGTTAQESASLYAVGVISKAFNGDEAAFLGRLNRRFNEILSRLALRVSTHVAAAKGIQSGPGSASQQQEILKMVKEKYFDGKDTFSRQQYINVISDMEFVGPVLNFLRLCRGDVFLYETDVDSKYNFLSRNLLNITYATTTCHADDLGYVFHPGVVDIHQDYKGSGLGPSVLRYTTTLFTNFIKG